MKAAQFTSLGKPEDILEVVSIDKPKPGPGEVLIKVSCCNINPSDIMFVQGLYGIQPTLPGVGGFEAAGVIEEVGEEVPMDTGSSVIFTAIGVWQEYVVVPAKTVIPKPKGMPDEVACQAFVNPYTAYAMVKESGLQSGDWLMITAGASAFGKFALQIAKAKGINVICTVRQGSANQMLLDMGAAAVVDTSEKGWHNQVKEISGKGVNAIFDAVGGDVGARAIECLAQNGTMLVFGLLSLRPSMLNNGLMIFKNLTVKGFWLTTWMTNLSTEEKIEVTKEVLTLLATNQLSADIDAKYPLDDIKKAVIHAQESGRKGKILLDLR
ncbi:MAG: zinc-dependent alcohol dehydrogenase family protein [bacterium]|nr:zinc-dependent alcohol dehydrogenase family protein [bacterium]